MLKLFFFGRLVSTLADKIMVFCLPVSIFAVTGNAKLSGLAYAVQWGPRLLLLPVLGRTVDRFPQRVQFVTVDGLRLVLVAILALPYVPLQMASLGLLSVLSGYSFLCMERVVSFGDDEHEVSRNQADGQSVDRVSRAMAPVIGALLLGSHTYWPLIAFCAALLLCALAATIVCFLPHRRLEYAGRQTSIFQDIRLASTLIFSSNGLLILTLLTAYLNYVDGLLISQLTPILMSVFRLPSEYVGLVSFMAVISGVGAITFLGRMKMWRDKKAEIGIGAFLVMVLAMLSTSQAKSAFIFTGLFIIFAISQNIFVLYLRAYRRKCIPEEHFGKMLGVMTTMLNSTMPFAGLTVYYFAGHGNSLALVGWGGLFSTCVLAATLLACGAAQRRRDIKPAH